MNLCVGAHAEYAHWIYLPFNLLFFNHWQVIPPAYRIGDWDAWIVPIVSAVLDY